MLEINFGESDYSIVEGIGMLSSPIILQFRNNQNPFTVMLSPVTVITAEGKGLDFFINSMTIDASSRATTGMWVITKRVFTICGLGNVCSRC